MKIKKEYIALVVVIVALVAYLVFHKTDRTLYQLPDVPKVSEKKISKLEITTKGEKILLNRKDDDWFIGEKAYLTDKGKVNDILDVLANLSVTALVSESKNYVRYELDDEKRISVKAWTGGDLSRELNIGKAASTYQHTFITLAGDPNIYHARGYFRLKFEKSMDDLRDKVVLSFKEEEIKAVEIYKDQSTTIISQKEKPSEKKEEKGTASEKDKGSEKDVQKQFEWQTADSKIMEAPKVKDLISYFTDLNCDAYIEDKNKEDFADKDPMMRITLKGEKNYSLSVFATDKETDDNKPAVSSMNPYPFLITSSTAEQIDNKIKALLNPEEKK
jgi:hypothetical protein